MRILQRTRKSKNSILKQRQRKRLRSEKNQQELKVSSKKIKTAGILKKIISKWKTLTHDKWVLSTVMGHKIEFDKKPFQGKFSTPINMVKFNDTAINLIQEEVSELLSKGAIKEIRHEDGEFISNLFLLKKKKKSGKFRPVINLKTIK